MHTPRGFRNWSLLPQVLTDQACAGLANKFSSFKGTEHSERLRNTAEECQTVGFKLLSRLQLPLACICVDRSLMHFWACVRSLRVLPFRFLRGWVAACSVVCMRQALSIPTRSRTLMLVLLTA